MFPPRFIKGIGEHTNAARKASGTAPSTVPDQKKYEIWVMAKNMPDELLRKYRWRIVWGQKVLILKSPILLFKKGSFKLFWARIKGKVDGLLRWWYFREKGKAFRERMRVSPEYIQSLFSK